MIATALRRRYGHAEVAYTVKRLEPETVLWQTDLSGDRTVGFKSPKSITYAVVDAAGNVVKTKNAATGKAQFETYPKKSAAQQATDHYNAHGLP